MLFSAFERILKHGAAAVFAVFTLFARSFLPFYKSGRSGGFAFIFIGRKQNELFKYGA